MPHATASSAATSTCSALSIGSCRNRRPNSRKSSGIAGREEAVRALAAVVVLDPLPRERLGGLARGLFCREDERDAATEDPLEDRPDERVVRTAEDHRVHAGLLQRLGVRANRVRDLLAERLVRLDERHEPRAGDRERPPRPASSARTSSTYLPLATVASVARRPIRRFLVGEDGGVRLGREDADHGNGELPLEIGERGRRRRVARSDDELHALLLEVARDLACEAPDLVQRPRPVRESRAVAEVDEVLVREGDEALVQDGEAAHAGVEHANRAGIHARGF